MDSLAAYLLIVLGVGFLVANVRAGRDLLRFVRLRSSAILTWPGRQPAFYGLMLGLGIVLGVLIFVKLVIQQRPPIDVFGVGMMFLYYGYVVPLSLKIGRGFYEEGIWADSGFIPYSQIGGLKWQEDQQQVTLVLISRVHSLGRHLVVPHHCYGEARRLLRDKIAAYDIHFFDKALDLGSRDERNVV